MNPARPPIGNHRILDRPDVLLFLFHPRPEPHVAARSAAAQDLLIPVPNDAVIGARFHRCGPSAPTVLFFHGNGEIVADYDELGPLYNRLGLNLLAVDYRGYGRSTGRPTVSTLLEDAPVVFDFALRWLSGQACHGPLLVMGRSLGSAAALELAAGRGHAFDALIIESGFAWTVPLLRLLGVDVDGLGIDEAAGFGQTAKIAAFAKPTLIIHAAADHIIPYADAEALYEASAAPDKRLLKIPRANHNDILMHGLDAYLAAIADLTALLRAT